MCKILSSLTFYGCFLLMESGIAYAQDPFTPTDEEVQFALRWLEQTPEASLTDEDTLFAAMLAQQHMPSLVPQFLGKELGSAEANTLRLNLAMSYCQSAAASDFCAGHSYIEELRNSDPDNIDPYLHALVQLADTNNYQAAYSVLVDGLKTRTTNDYYFAKLQISRRKLIAIGYPAGRINTAGEALPTIDFFTMYYRVLAICPEQSHTSADWKAACLTLGKRLEESGRTALVNMIGFGLQRDVLTNNPVGQEVVELAAVLERRAAYVLVRDTLPLKVDGWLNPVTRPASYYDAAFEIGEMPAMKQLLESYE